MTGGDTCDVFVFVGARPVGGGATDFAVWAPFHEAVSVHLLDPDSDRVVSLERVGGGYHRGRVSECPAGSRYRYRLPDGRELADPASRSQPDGVDGPSAVVDLASHRWGDGGYRPRPFPDHVISEIHVGTFTAAGTFDSAAEDLDRLVDVGITAVEVMPVAAFPGRRNWGYDGVFPFAVQESYGGPAGLQRFVDACHQRGLAVVLDVVYNHLGPEGNVLGEYGPYFTDRYSTPWGPAVNFDSPGSDGVRAYFSANAGQWFADFHVDALRLDAVHEIVDRSARPWLGELASEVRELSQALGRELVLVAESADNDPRVVSAREVGGLGLDAQWNDDFHHALHACLTGERSGYYVDYGAVADVATAMTDGFVYQARYSAFRERCHGAPSISIPPGRFVVFAQNHDHIGNRPGAERLSALVGDAQLRLAAAALLLAPGVPLLFMGEEYGETAPFPYFVDHSSPELIEAVRRGRAEEFAEIAEQSASYDPADPATFEAAELDRSLSQKDGHAELADVYRRLIALRAAHPVLRRSARHLTRAHAAGDVVTLVRAGAGPAGSGSGSESIVVFFNFGSEPTTAHLDPALRWVELLATPVGDGAPGSPTAGDPAASDRPPGGDVQLAPFGFRIFSTPGELR